MAERLYQLRFDETLKPTAPQDVTPKGFAGLGIEKGKRPGRFVHQVKESVQFILVADVGQYLLDKVFTPFTEFNQEELWVLLLDTKNHVTHQVMVYRGTVSSTFIRTAEVLGEAVRVNAPNIIISHNHPSGDPSPSPEDVRITRLINEAANVLDVNLLDHVIVGRDCWVSLKERGLGFDP